MFKFKFDYLQNTLAYQKESFNWEQVPESQQFKGNFGSLGFKLGVRLEAGRITFTLCSNKIIAFYKYRKAPRQIIRYQKVLPKEVPVIFEFTESDRIEKINGKWVKKGSHHE